ncbi:carbonic anhydrase family protein [Nostoc sp. NOS(2021)]|uniref:carbonic anhydrase family protein n=1 Tax=Nostoc sp. NOS(2021) TaxID=2815407 RepID=UPI0025FD1730|nr:carbonic anhydrase family protein [Nostoc sp. NOS(2021)]
MSLLLHPRQQHKKAVNAEQFLPKDRKVYRYFGSLTTPRCSQGVNWIVMPQPIEISQNQIQRLFLGASAGALIGLLGGAGVAIGLLLKDLIYDLCCTIIIYLDNLFRPGDQVTMYGVEGLIKVEQVGLRSTTLRILSRNTIQKVPNSKMINGVVENCFQSVGNDNLIGINLTLKIDGISAEKTEKICIGLREIPKSIDILTEKFFIYFSELNQNSRIIKIRVFANTNGNPQLYFDTIEKLNLAILTLLEKEQINLFSYYPVQLQTNLGEAQNNLEPSKN